MSKLKHTGVQVADAVQQALISANELDVNYEPANVVDSLFFIGRALHRIAAAMENPPPAGIKQKIQPATSQLDAPTGRAKASGNKSCEDAE